MTLAEALIEYKVDTVISGAIFDLLGYLTTRPTSISVGADSECPPVLERFVTWAQENGLDINDADVSHWEAVLGRGLGESTEYNWDSVKGGGYELADGAAKLQRKGKIWFLVIPSIPKEIKLGKKASFDTANKALDNVLGK